MLSEYQAAFRAFRSEQRAYEEACQEAEELRREQDYRTVPIRPAGGSRSRVGRTRIARRGRASALPCPRVREELSSAASALEDDEHGALPALYHALRSVESIRRYHTPAAEWYERLESVRIELQDLASSMSDEAEEVTFSPKRLAKVEARLDLIRGLLHKHSLTSCDELIALRDDLSSRLEQINSSDEHLTALSEALKKREAEVLRLGKALSKTRTKAARAIEGALITTLHELGMPHVRFVIRQDILDAPTLHGLDHVTFLFSANKEIEPEPVAEIASGGEISRLMLAIKALIADRRSLPTIIFDEIDTGVSGETAERIATILAAWARACRFWR